jgi:hypothetical protein
MEALQFPLLINVNFLKLPQTFFKFQYGVKFHSTHREIYQVLKVFRTQIYQ